MAVRGEKRNERSIKAMQVCGTEITIKVTASVVLVARLINSAATRTDSFEVEFMDGV